MTTPMSGTQYTLESGAAVAHVASVGASLRRYRYDDRDLVVPFEADEVRPLYRGATLAPWPNRVVDGRYSFGSAEHQLALNETAYGHALHGLVAWLDFHPTDQRSDSITLAATIEPQTGYPWRLRLEVSYVLGPDGLTQTVRATNLSPDRAPFGTGPHPYLVAGSGLVDDWTLELPARRVLLTDDRLAPTDLVDVSVDPSRFDFSAGRRIGSTEIDHAFTDLVRDESGHAVVRLTGRTGQGVAMRWGPACPWVQIHTADLPGGFDDPGHRAGLAVEPMTCAPDAFNIAAGGVGGPHILSPGSSTSAGWTIYPLPTPPRTQP